MLAIPITSVKTRNIQSCIDAAIMTLALLLLSLECGDHDMSMTITSITVQLYINYNAFHLYFNDFSLRSTTKTVLKQFFHLHP